MSRLTAQRDAALRALGAGRTVHAVGVARAPLIGGRHWLALSGDTLFVLALDRSGTVRVEGAVSRADCAAAGPALGPFLPVDVAGRRLWVRRKHSDPGLVSMLTAAPRAPGQRAAPARRAAPAGDGVDVAVSRSWLAVAGGVVGAALLVAWAVAGWP